MLVFDEDERISWEELFKLNISINIKLLFRGWI